VARNPAEMEWMRAAKRHIREIGRIGYTARCEEGCPCDRAAEVYRHCKSGEVASYVERVYPEAVLESEKLA
jgi:hypothetical protein